MTDRPKYPRDHWNKRHPDPLYDREFTDDAIQVFNWYRKKIGTVPMTRFNQGAVSGEEWDAMTPAERAELWTYFPTKERP